MKNQPSKKAEARIAHIYTDRFHKKEWQTTDEKGFFELVMVIEYSAYQALQEKLKIATDCLRKIADEDFRGNRPQASVDAYNAIRKIEGHE